MHILQYNFAKFKDSREICIHLLLKFSNLLLCHLIFRMIEYFLTEHFEYVEVIFADIHVFERGRTDVVNE